MDESPLDTVASESDRSCTLAQSETVMADGLRRMVVCLGQAAVSGRRLVLRRVGPDCARLEVYYLEPRCNLWPPYPSDGRPGQVVWHQTPSASSALLRFYVSWPSP